jgi:hypothetical protein
VDRAPGLSVRLKLTLSYAGFLVLAGALLLALWVVLMRIFPHAPIIRATRSGIGGAFAPGRSPTQQAFGQAGVAVLAFLLVFGLVGGWILAGHRSSAAPNAYTVTMQGSASAWPSSRASPRHTTEPSLSPPGPLGGSASRWNYPSRHRTLADDDQRNCRTAPRGIVKACGGRNGLGSPVPETWR